ncbi:MAG: tail fiber domain-containing protein, partial [Pyrinomonadaceae bacterium]
GDNNTVLGANADVGSGNLTYATAIGANAIGFESNTIVLGRSAGQDTVHIWGKLRVGLDGTGTLDVCRNAEVRLASCSSSLRYKTNVETYVRGLDVVKRLRPITFDWKSGGEHDIGFGAEEVNAVEPLFVTYNDHGEIEGVKYKQLTTVLVNAVNEQQAEISRQEAVSSRQQKEIEILRQQVADLTALVCELKPQAKACIRP